jgi:hypothetical protein
MGEGGGYNLDTRGKNSRVCKGSNAMQNAKKNAKKIYNII